jgi:LmbE family N-acetylglucosaminyl deacetylase
MVIESFLFKLPDTVKNMKKLLSFPALVPIFLASVISLAPADTRPALEDRGASGLALTLRRLQTIESLLHTGAHPDDESTELLAYMARAHGARVAYLSLNRGEGGQNGIGPELWEGLGVLRTEELLAARKLDGAEQYFTRAFDFGFTRSADETLKKWNREEVLGDMVRVIRMVRPLVVVSGFSGTSRDGHGQHQVAGMLTPEAIKAAADASRFPEQITKEGLEPWQVLKMYGRVFGQAQGMVATFDVGQFDPILGRSYAELAAEGRSKHRSQDFGMIQPKGTQVRSYPRLMSLVDVPDKESSLFTGIDTSLTGIAKFAKSGDSLAAPLGRIKELAARAETEYRPEHPESIEVTLASGLHEVRALRAQIAQLDAVSRANVDGMLARKEHDFETALVKARGIIVDALSSSEIVTPGETVDVTVSVYAAHSAAPRASDAGVPAMKLSVVGPDNWRVEQLGGSEMEAPTPGFRGRDQADAVSRFRASVPTDEPPTQPYWLVRERTRDQFDWDDRMPRGLPFAPPRLNARVVVQLGGEQVTIIQPVEYRFANKTLGEVRRELKVTPPLVLTLRPSLLVIPAESDNRTREISVEITHNARHSTKGEVKLLVPQGWEATTSEPAFEFSRQGEHATRIFRVSVGPGKEGSVLLKGVATADGHEYGTGYTAVAYPHVETHFIYHPAVTKAEVFDVRVAAGLRVGYIMGSGDDVPEALEQLGVPVKLINETELASGDLAVYDTIILGIRAYEGREDLAANNQRLLDYVKRGGTLIVQYNKQEFGRGFAPYPVKLDGGLRVTDEEAPVTILAPDHPLFNYPNKITQADFKGWVQERGLYFLNEWDSKYTPMLSSTDERGSDLKGGELIAKVGQGNYIFTAYAWFRQLPAGVPGAYRLFANLISLPKNK